MSGLYYTDTQQRGVLRGLRELVRSRELLLDLVRKELRSRYRYAFMGFLWAVFEPVMLMLILSFVFGVVFRNRLPSGGQFAEYPFALVLLCALVPWQFFSNALPGAAQSLVDNENLVKKVHFCREVIPLAAVGNCVINFCIGFTVLLILHVAFQQHLGLAIFWFPFVFAIQFALVVGLSLLFACANVFFRDVGYIVNVLMLFGFYGTPIFYELDYVRGAQLPWLPEALWPWFYRIYQLNPMAGLIKSYRQILFLNRFPDPEYLAWPLVFAVGSLVIGFVVFRRKAPFFSDYL